MYSYLKVILKNAEQGKNLASPAEKHMKFVQAAAEQVKEFGLASRETCNLSSSSRASKIIWPRQQRKGNKRKPNSLLALH